MSGSQYGTGFSFFGGDGAVLLKKNESYPHQEKKKNSPLFLLFVGIPLLDSMKGVFPPGGFQLHRNEEGCGWERFGGKELGSGEGRMSSAPAS